MQIQVLKNKPFDTLSMSQQSFTYNKIERPKQNQQPQSSLSSHNLNKVIKVLHPPTPPSQQEQQCPMRYNQKNRKKHRSVINLSRHESQQSSHPVEFQSIARQRGNSKPIENIKNTQQAMYVSAYNHDYNNNPNDIINTMRSSCGMNRSQRQDTYNQIRLIKKEIEQEHAVNNRQTVEQAIKKDKNKQKKEKEKEKDEPLAQKEQAQNPTESQLSIDTQQLHSQLVHLLGSSLSDQVELETLINDNMPYISHLLNQCICSQGHTTCPFQKDQIATFKVQLKHKQKTSYEREMTNKTCLPSLNNMNRQVIKNRLERGRLNHTSIINSTNSQQEYIGKTVPTGRGLAGDTSISIEGPGLARSTYQMQYVDFSQDHQTNQTVRPQGQLPCQASLGTITNYNKSYGIPPRQQICYAKQKPSKPIVYFAPFVDTTTNQEQDRFINSHKFDQENVSRKHQKMESSQAEVNLKKLRYEGEFRTQSRKSYDNKMQNNNYVQRENVVQSYDMDQLKQMLLDRVQQNKTKQ